MKLLKLVGRAAALALAVVVVCGASDAQAHSRTATFSDIVVGGDGPGRVTWTIRARVRDLVEAGLGEPLAHRAQVVAYLAAGLHVEEGGAPCSVADGSVGADTRAAEPTVAARLVFACGGGGGVLTLRYDLFFAQDPLHTGYATVASAGRPATTQLFRARERTASVAAPRGPLRAAAAYLRLGVEHIFTGYDHLAFLAALLLAAGLRHRAEALREVLQIVTAFTVAHSITLIASTLRPALLPTVWVEPAIALSIAYVAIENLLARAPGRRWPVVFLFGLVHGLGFSSVLREVGLPARGLVVSLLAFNLGVELGQLAVVSLLLPPLLLMARRRPYAFQRWGLRGGSAALALAGVVWFVLRVRS